MDKNAKKLAMAVAVPLAHTAAQRWAQRQGMEWWQAMLIGALVAAAATALIQQSL